MNREEIRERLSLFLDGELDEVERRVVTEQIQKDEVWKEEFSRLRRTTASMRDYFRTSNDALARDRGGEEEAVARIVRESTMTLRQSAVQRWSLSGNGILARRALILVALVAVVGCLIVWASYRRRHPDASSLLESVAELVAKGSFELVVTFKSPDSDAAPEVMEVGPRGQVHARTTVGGETVHAGFDGARYWSYRAAENAVRIVDPQKSTTHRKVFEAADLWQAFHDRLADIRRGAGKVERVDDSGLAAGAEDVVLRIEGKPGPHGELLLVIDPAHGLTRIEAAGYSMRVTERRLAPEHFVLENWAPGIPLKDER